MDLRLFHSNPNGNYKGIDRLNSWTKLWPCRLLEWSSWYYLSLPYRLLGHYRQFQLYKKFHGGRSKDIPPIHGYILQCRVYNGAKFRFFVFLSRIATMWGYPERMVEIYAINKSLLYEHADILHEFLANANIDFENAYKTALRQIHAPEFLNTAAITNTSHSNVLVQVKHDHNTVNNNSTNELHIHPVIKEGSTVKETVIIKETPPAKDPISGKEKGVFSKKQVLILFDLLAYSGKIEHLQLQKHQKKIDAIAQFLQALTGKGKETWIEELKDYRDRDLYEFHTPGEKKQLLIVLENLATLTRNAGLRSIAGLVDKKIIELEKR